MLDHHALTRHFGGQLGPIGGSGTGPVALGTSSLTNYTEQSRHDGELIMGGPGNGSAHGTGVNGAALYKLLAVLAHPQGCSATSACVSTSTPSAPGRSR